MARSQNPLCEFTPNSQGTIAKLVVREQLIGPNGPIGGGSSDGNHTYVAWQTATIGIVADQTTLRGVAFDGVTAPIPTVDESVLVEARVWFGAVLDPAATSAGFTLHIQDAPTVPFPAQGEWLWAPQGATPPVDAGGTIVATHLFAGVGSPFSVYLSMLTTIADFFTLNVYDLTIKYTIIPNANILP